MFKVYTFLFFILGLFSGCNQKEENELKSFDGVYVFSEEESLKYIDNPSDIQRKVFREMRYFDIKVEINNGKSTTHVANDIHQTDTIEFRNDTLYFNLFDSYNDFKDSFVIIDKGLLYIDDNNSIDSINEKRIAIFVKNQN